MILLVFGILAPFLYGAMGFVFGAIGAWIYNLIAKRLGGIEIQLEAVPASLIRRNSRSAGRSMSFAAVLAEPGHLASAVLKSRVRLVISNS